MSGSATVGFVLVVVGLFSVISYTVALQTHEIGIRMALGAQQASIFKMVLTKGFRLLAAGIVVGLFASHGLTRFLASQSPSMATSGFPMMLIWGVSATDAWTFGGVAAIVVAVGSAACFLPARRATRVDPMVALRYGLRDSVNVTGAVDFYDSMGAGVVGSAGAGGPGVGLRAARAPGTKNRGIRRPRDGERRGAPSRSSLSNSWSACARRNN